MDTKQETWEVCGTSILNVFFRLIELHYILPPNVSESCSILYSFTRKTRHLHPITEVSPVFAYLLIVFLIVKPFISSFFCLRNIVINLLITHSPLAPDTTDIEAQASRRKNTVQLAIVIIHTVFRIMMIKTFHGYSFNKLRSRETKKHPQITFQTNTTFTKSGIVRHFLLISILWNVSILEPIFLSVYRYFVRLT